MSSSTKSQQKHVEDMSFLEKLGILPKICYTLAITASAVITGIFRKESPAYGPYVLYTAFRTLFTITTTKQQHYLNVPTDDAYKAFCKQFKLQPESETLADGTTAHWIGPKTASKVIINFHGGGYVLPAFPCMFEFQYQIQQKISKHDKDVAVIFLSYDLAPVAKYPRQLIQATALIDHLVNNLDKKPSNMILIGDSAGGNLISQLLSHISHPHPSVPPLNIEKFHGACLISPWVDLSASDPSMTKNESKDFLSIGAGRKWSSAFMKTPWPHKDSIDAYNTPSSAPKGWWDDVMVEDIFIVGGENEILIDGIKRFAETLKEALGDRVSTAWIANENHDQAATDILIGCKPGGTAQAITNWASSKL